MDEPRREKIATADEVIDETPVIAAEPPKVYFAACGSLCDVFWWARKPATDS
jgi:hypothetical protein